jgi:tRNA-dihydrouridine synthase
VVGKGGGSGLLCHPDAFFTLINDIITRLGPGVLSVKMRTGFHNDEEFGGLLAGLMNFPLYWLNVHGRTRDDRYRGEARWDYAMQAATRLAWPVVGSGDLVSYKKLEGLMPSLRPLGGVFVGRGALRNPWLYHELRTGCQVTISFGLLRTAIYVYAYLAHAASVDLERFIDLCKEIDFATPCHNNQDLWLSLLEKLCRALAPVAGPPSQLIISSKVLGRIKMIWRSLRTSLPACFMDQSMTQSQTLADFMSALEVANKAYQGTGDDNLMTLQHDPDMDHWFAR